jgi:hypothetical protein
MGRTQASIWGSARGCTCSGRAAPAPEVIKAMAKKDKLIAIESALKSAVELGIAMKPSGKFEEVFDACVEAAIRAADKMDAAASK